MFPDYGGNCLTRKGVQNLVKIFSQANSKDTDDARPRAELTETIDQNFYVAGFDALVKRWDKSINIGRGYVNK
jgi:hypothetical protein